MGLPFTHSASKTSVKLHTYYAHYDYLSHWSLIATHFWWQCHDKNV